MTDTLAFFLRTSDETLSFGAKLTTHVKAGTIIFLNGNLGSGKTTLVRGFLQQLGITSVKSPTYTLLESYEIAGIQFFHFDLYRIKNPCELRFIGIEAYLDGDSVCFIEWPEKGGGFLPTPDLIVSLESAGKGRLLQMSAASNVGEKCLRALSS